MKADREYLTPFIYAQYRIESHPNLMTHESVEDLCPIKRKKASFNFF